MVLKFERLQIRALRALMRCFDCRVRQSGHVELLQPSLTTVQQPVYRLGSTATELPIQRITGLDEASQEITLETELIRRNSVVRDPATAQAQGRKQRALASR